MRVCVVIDADRPGFRGMEREGGLGLALSFLSPAEVFGGSGGPVLPAADLYVLPIAAYSGIREEHRPFPVFAYGSAEGIRTAFVLGCLDYLREPWTLDELEARSLRLDASRISIAGVEVELRGHLLASAFGNIRLTEEETRIYRMLVLNLNRPVPREAFSVTLGGDFGKASRAPDVHISSLRRKLKAILPPETLSLKASRNKGYILEGATCG